MRKILLTLILVLVVIILGILGRAGFFSSIRIESVQAGPLLLGCQAHQGDYADSPVIMDAVYNQLKALGIQTTQGFGIYFDNPKDTPREKLRALLGNIVPPENRDSLSALQPPFKVREFPVQECLQVIFPYEGQLSVMAGIMKVYPAVSAHLEKNKLPRHAAIEIYDIPAKKIIYLFPLNPPRDMLEQYYQ